MTPTRYLPMLFSRETVHELNRIFTEPDGVAVSPRVANEVRKVTAAALLRAAPRGVRP